MILFRMLCVFLCVFLSGICLDFVLFVIVFLIVGEFIKWVNSCVCCGKLGFDVVSFC